jgi:hypothetical protein
MFDEAKAAWTNANDKPDAIGILRASGRLGQMKVVALGNAALRTLEKQHVQVHALLPHPQFGRRFQHGGKAYQDRLALL